ncbi:MAG: acetyl-CoA C-acyltransferase [Flavobacteriales bacterium]|nr:acetyl-CoA C-acyltransferase [Flavobacteriales bacterium]
MQEVYIVSAVRTPVGSFMGSLANVSATRLGAAAISGAINKIGIDVKEIDEVMMGCVLQAGLGQAPARQAAIYAGLPESVICTTINKVCASGLKSVAMAAQSIMLGDAEVIVAGGMENMSSVPHYLVDSRKGYKFGQVKMNDGIQFDGLQNVYDGQMMGSCAELCTTDHGFTREMQDEFAIQSYKRAAEAWSEGRFKDEVVPVEIPQRKGDPILFTEDEEYKNVKFDKIPQLAPVFKKDGAITAANASTMNDGASALILMSKNKMEQLGLKPLAKIVSFADAEQAPEWFTTSPSLALPKALKRANMTVDDLDYIELNEAFAVVGLVNLKLMKLDNDKVNVNGGAVSLGHPLGSSGSRILVTLIHILKNRNARFGGAAICNGGGGGSAMVIECMS